MIQPNEVYLPNPQKCLFGCNFLSIYLVSFPLDVFLRYNYNRGIEMDCLAFHQWFAFYILFVSSSSPNIALTSLLKKWSNDEGLICHDHRATRSQAKSVGFFIYLIFLCFSVFFFFSCLFPCNLTWRCSLWQIKDSHLWSVSFP